MGVILMHGKLMACPGHDGLQIMATCMKDLASDLQCLRFQLIRAHFVCVTSDAILDLDSACRSDRGETTMWSRAD